LPYSSKVGASSATQVTLRSSSQYFASRKPHNDRNPRNTKEWIIDQREEDGNLR
jgi:hypothetical protein